MLSCLSMDTTPQELISFPSDNFFYLSVCQAGMRSGHLPNWSRIWSCDHGDATTVGEEGNFREIHFYTEPSLRSSRFLSFSRLRSNKRAKSGGAKEHVWGEQNWGEVGRWWARRGEGVRRKGITRSQSQRFLPKSVRPRTGSNSAISLVISPSFKIWHKKFVFHA